jgi:hypothetical protein
MKANRVSTAAFVLSAVLGTAAILQQSPWGFFVLGANERAIAAVRLQQVPYKPGTEPTVFWNLDDTKVVRDKDGQVISGFGFYGWTDGTTTRVAVIARLPPEGAENKFYSWPELNKRGLKARLALFATYTLTAGESKVMEELKAVGAESASLRIQMSEPK